MLVATKKRKENIAEYILYMFQIEDLIRAFNFDKDKIVKIVISQYKVSETEQLQIADWYLNLSVMMVKEGLQDKGHLQFLLNLMDDLERFHLKLIQSESDKEYVAMFKSVAGVIQEFNSKSGKKSGDVVACISALYMYLLLKLQKKDVSAETGVAMKSFGQLLSKLSGLYKDFEEGNLEL